MDSDLDSCPSSLLLPPVQHELLSLQQLQKGPGNSLDLKLLRLSKRRRRAHEQVVDRKLFLIKVLGESPALLLVERLCELNQLLEERLDVHAARVVLVDQLLK